MKLSLQISTSVNPLNSLIWHLCDDGEECSQYVGPKSPIDVKLGCNLVTAKVIAYDSHYFHTRRPHQWPLGPCGWWHYFFLKRPLPSGMFHHKLREITQNVSVLICSGLSLQGDKWTQNMRARCLWQHNRATGSSFLIYHLSVCHSLFQLTQVVKTTTTNTGFSGLIRPSILLIA